MGLKYNSTSFSIQLFTLVQTRLLFLGPEWLGREGGRGIGRSRDVASGDGAGRARGVVSEGAGRARGTKGGGTGLTGFTTGTFTPQIHMVNSLVQTRDHLKKLKNSFGNI
jgi:hypothetical protein